MTVEEFLEAFESTHRTIPMVIVDGHIRNIQEDSKYCPITAVARDRLTNTPIEIFRPRVFDAAYAAEWAAMLGIDPDDAEAIQLASDGETSSKDTETRERIRKRMMEIVTAVDTAD